MPRMDEWEREIHESKLAEGWGLAGPRRIVKVVAMGRPPASELQGYFTMEKSLIGKTPHQIERALGLPTGSFREGCRIYRFTRLPMMHEYEYELTALYPDGLAFNPADLEEARARRRLDPTSARIPVYMPGSPAVHQWRLKTDVPVEHLLDLPPDHPYPYLHR